MQDRALIHVCMGAPSFVQVIALHTHQFKEDSSGMAHPIRPESVVVQDNFYTTTVYVSAAAVFMCCMFVRSFFCGCPRRHRFLHGHSGCPLG